MMWVGGARPPVVTEVENDQLPYTNPCRRAIDERLCARAQSCGCCSKQYDPRRGANRAGTGTPQWDDGRRAPSARGPRCGPVEAAEEHELLQQPVRGRALQRL